MIKAFHNKPPLRAIDSIDSVWNTVDKPSERQLFMSFQIDFFTNSMKIFSGRSKVGNKKKCIFFLQKKYSAFLQNNTFYHI
jgi:hypothetical protein